MIFFYLCIVFRVTFKKDIMLVLQGSKDSKLHFPDNPEICTFIQLLWKERFV